MPNIDGKEYPRLENGVIIEAPAIVEREDDGVNINSAGYDELVEIKGIGHKAAEALVHEREENGPFPSLDDCADRVAGITVKKLQSANARV